MKNPMMEQCASGREPLINRVIADLHDLRGIAESLRELADRRLATLIIPQPPMPGVCGGNEKMPTQALPPLHEELVSHIRVIREHLMQTRRTIEAVEV